MNKFILILSAFIATQSQAQFKELNYAMSKGMQNGLKIHIDSVDQSTAFDLMAKVIADKDPKVDATIISFGELFFDNATYPNISAQPIDIYARFNTSDTSLIVFVDMGTGFVNAATNPTEANGMQQLGYAIQEKNKTFRKQNNIDSLKLQIKLMEAKLERCSDDLKTAENAIKNNIKGAGKDDKQAAKTETKLQDNKSEISETDTLIMRKQKSFDAFPLSLIKSENEIKNKSLQANRKLHKNLAKANAKSEDKILDYKVEIEMNNTKKSLAADDKKVVRKIDKTIEKLNQKIANEQNEIVQNKSKMKVYTDVIVADSIIVSANNGKLNAFDEAGRVKELKQLRAKSEKLKAKSEKQKTAIVENKQDSELKRKEAEAATKRVETLKIEQAQIKAELAILRMRLIELGGQ
ncbi:MAG: hypothetical protein PSX81_09300 [bacterium]|nr:hypothetical protein [bacterium]